MKHRKYNLLKIGLGLSEILIAFVMYAITEALFLNISIVNSNQLSIIIALLITGFFIWFISAIYIYKLRQDNLRQINLSLHWNFKQLIWPLLGLILILIIQLLNNQVNSIPSTNQATLLKLRRITNPIFDILLLLIGPYFEELIFRGIFFNFFFTRPNITNNVIGIICNGAFFGFCHEQNIMNTNFITYTICGCILAAIYLKTKDIKYSYICHVGNNLLALI